MSDRGYSIFNHAQLGHVEHAPKPRVEPKQKPEPQPEPPARVRSPRGWASDIGLGLGRHFGKGRQP